MLPLASIVRFLEQLAPLRLAEEWDNVGLLVGDPDRPVQRAMTCLTITPATAAEAVREAVDLVVSHHPLPFQPLARLTTETTAGRLLLGLAAAAWPFTVLTRPGIRPPKASTSNWPDGWACATSPPWSRRRRPGHRPRRLARRAARARPTRPTREGIAGAGARAGCGPAGQPVARSRSPAERPVSCSNPHSAGYDGMLTGEARFHTCLEAEARGVALILVGHYASERLGAERLSELLTAQFPDWKYGQAAMSVTSRWL